MKEENERIKKTQRHYTIYSSSIYTHEIVYNDGGSSMLTSFYLNISIPKWTDLTMYIHNYKICNTIRIYKLYVLHGHRKCQKIYIYSTYIFMYISVSVYV